MSEDQVSCSIAIDAMGGDRGTAEVIRGLEHAINELKLDCRYVLVGKKRLLTALLKARDLYGHPKIEIVPATQIIGMDEKPVQALKKKTSSSMVVAIDLLKNGEVDAMVSCGNTGALMAGGTIKIRPLEGIDRPALGVILPTREKPCVLIDVGANPESTAEHLVHNAILASNYAKATLNLHRPRVGLLTIGTEEGKGTPLIHRTHEYLQEMGTIVDYRGPIEGFQLFDGIVDVVVTDGFTGNVLLKACEAAYQFIGSSLKQAMLRNVKRKIGAALSASAFRDMKTQLSPDKLAGAPLLGLRSNILKTHGSSNQFAIASAIRVATEVVTHDMIDSIRHDINTANDIILMMRS